MTYCPNMANNTQRGIDIRLKTLTNPHEGPERPKIRYKRTSGQNRVNRNRILFGRYCVRAAYNAKERVKGKGIPFEIDYHFIDRLLVDQKWCCAVSGVDLTPPGDYEKKRHRDPFGPSLDRIQPALGYVPGNLRVVSNIVNLAMNEWGLEALLVLVDKMAARPKPKKRGRPRKSPPPQPEAEQ